MFKFTSWGSFGWSSSDGTAAAAVTSSNGLVSLGVGWQQGVWGEILVVVVNETNPDRAKHVTFKRSNSKFKKEKTNMMGTDTFSSDVVVIVVCTMVVMEDCMVATVTAINVMTLSVGGRNS